MATTEPPSLLDCPVCCEKYKNPKMVSCGHTFCLDPCLRNLVQSSSPNCPLCRIPIQVPLSGKVDDLPTNFVLQSMVEVQTANMGGLSAVQKWNDTSPTKQKKCSTHDENLVSYCATCSELLCPKCRAESHNKYHDILQVQEAVDGYCGMLASVEKDLKDISETLNDVSLFLEDAEKICKAESDKIRGKIDEAEEMAIQEVKERKAELYLELDELEIDKLNYLQDLTAKAVELSLFSECTQGMCGKMKLELKELNFKKKSAIDSVIKKTKSLLKDVSNLENEAFDESAPIVFQSNEKITLGVLKDQSQDGKKLCFSVTKLIDLQCFPPNNYSYTSFTLLSANTIIFLFQRPTSQNSSLKALYRTGQKEQSLTDVPIEGSISFASSIHINNKTKFLFVKDHHTPLEVIFNESDKTFSVNSSVTVSNALLYGVSALTWDECGENCYALLSDGQTIKRFSFTPEKRETFHVKLNQKVYYPHSGRFHVCQFGMAICTEHYVLFYESTKSSYTTRTLEAPSDATGWTPRCVMSLQKDKKWYVQWTNRNNNFSLVYQYSSSFEEELTLPEVSGNFSSFSFLDEKYISTDKFRRSCHLLPSELMVSVYGMERS